MRRPSRLQPTFSVDGGLIYERELAFDSHSLVQTLEPRAYYLLVPPRNQADQPLFDTGYATVDFAQLFRENRFNGADRVGDANQLTLALSSRVFSATRGTEARPGQCRSDLLLPRPWDHPARPRPGGRFRLGHHR